MTTVSPHERVIAAAPEAPDADFEALREEALAAVREHADPASPGAWTDHNVHDPGITLLEAIVWAIADAHYRTGERGFEGWAAEIAPWRPSPAPRGRTERIAAARVLREHLAQARELAAASRSRAAAADRLRLELPAAAADRPGAPAAAALVALLREPLLLRAALDRSDAVTRAADEAGTSGPAAQGAVGDAVVDLGLWPEEISALLARERRRRLAELLEDRGDELRAAAGGLSPVSEVEQRFDLDPAEAGIAAAAHPCPRVGPRMWEDDAHAGATELWPPHPLQARTCEPVTGEDYRRLAAAVPEVRRAWVVPGTAAGIRWSGDPQSEAAPRRQGGITLLVEPATTPDRPEDFLRSCLGAALGFPGEHSEVDLWTAPRGDPAALDFRENRDWLSPRRLLGDEVGAALIGRCGVVVKGVLHIEATTSGEAVLAEANRLLQGFLSAERAHPHEPPPPPPAPLRCPDELDGPWPRAPADLDAPWPAAPPPQGGWPPGEPVRVSEVVQVLETIPEVVGVDGLELQLEAGGEWQKETLDIDPFCVPELDRHCLLADLLNPRSCDD